MRISVQAVLENGKHDYAQLHLEQRLFDVDFGSFSPSGDHDVVLVATDQPLVSRQASALRNFVRRGGGLVLLHSTLAAWSSSEAIRELAGWVPSGPGPLTELIVRPDPKHPITAQGDHPGPAGFSAIDFTWPQRKSKAGTYDAAWLKNRFPGFPSDIDFSCGFHANFCSGRRSRTFRVTAISRSRSPKASWLRLDMHPILPLAASRINHLR